MPLGTQHVVDPVKMANLRTVQDALRAGCNLPRNPGCNLPRFLRPGCNLPRFFTHRLCAAQVYPVRPPRACFRMEMAVLERPPRHLPRRRAQPCRVAHGEANPPRKGRQREVHVAQVIVRLVAPERPGALALRNGRFVRPKLGEACLRPRHGEISTLLPGYLSGPVALACGIFLKDFQRPVFDPSSVG